MDATNNSPTSASSTDAGISGAEIRLENVTKRYSGTKEAAVEDVSLTIPAGEICVMLGPSGTGKSVFLKTLIGLQWLQKWRAGLWTLDWGPLP